MDEKTSEKLQRLAEKREEYLMIRDILALELEIRELKKEFKTNGDTNKKESQSSESV
jgi:hypothetical protein